MPLTLEITLRDETLEEDAFQIIKVVRPNWNPETVRSKVSRRKYAHFHNEYLLMILVCKYN